MSPLGVDETDYREVERGSQPDEALRLAKPLGVHVVYLVVKLYISLLSQHHHLIASQVA